MSNPSGCISFSGITYTPVDRYVISVYGRRYNYYINFLTDSINGELINELNHYVHYADSPGIIMLDSLVRSYFDVVTSSGECGHLTSSANNGIEPDHFVKVYPNPVFDYLYIYGLKQETRFELYNLLGTIVLTTKLYAGSNGIELKNLTSGMYIYILLEESQTGKILVN